MHGPENQTQSVASVQPFSGKSGPHGFTPCGEEDWSASMTSKTPPALPALPAKGGQGCWGGVLILISHQSDSPNETSSLGSWERKRKKKGTQLNLCDIETQQMSHVPSCSATTEDARVRKPETKSDPSASRYWKLLRTETTQSTNSKPDTFSDTTRYRGHNGFSRTVAVA